MRSHFFTTGDIIGKTEEQWRELQISVCVPGANPNPPTATFTLNCKGCSVGGSSVQGNLVLIVPENVQNVPQIGAITIELHHNKGTVPGISRYRFKEPRILSETAVNEKYITFRTNISDKKDRISVDFLKAFDFEALEKLYIRFSISDTCYEVADCENSEFIIVEIQVIDQNDEPTLNKTESAEKCELQFHDEDKINSEFYDLFGIEISLAEKETHCDDAEENQSVSVKFLISNNETTSKASIAPAEI